jgi:hypothetical protein
MGAIWCRGCSFTFGEGLQFFSNLKSVDIPKYHMFDYEDLTHAQYRFIQNNRYSKILADLLDVVDVNSSKNGGTNNGIYNELNLLNINDTEIRIKDRVGYKRETYARLDEIDYIVIQFTNIYRDELLLNGKVYPQLNMVTSIDEYIKKYLTDDLTFDEYTKMLCEQTITNFKKLFKKIEGKNPNIKIRVFSWENELDEYLRNDEYFKDKTITFSYKDKEYKTLRDIIYGKLKLTIQETFHPMCRNDQHMNLEGHRLIAESIYKTLI